MEDENGIELSLGLSCGGSSAKLKLKNGSESDTRTDEGEKGNKLVDSFKSFLHAGNQNQDSGQGSQRTDPVKTHDKFFNNLSMNVVDADSSSRGLWVTNNRSVEADEEKSYRHESSGKRKMLFDELNHLKKQEKVAHDAADKNSQMGILHSTKTSHISINPEDGSTAEIEDVAESEVEGSTSRLVLHLEEGAKPYAANVGSSEVPKEIHGYSDSNVVNLQGQKRFSKPSENDFKIGSVTYGVAYAAQPLNMMNFPYSLPAKEANTVGAPSTSGYMQLTPPSNDERLGTQHTNSGNLPLTFGYSPVQLPMLDKEHTWSLGSNPQQFPPSYAGKGTPGATPNPDGDIDGLKLSQATQALEFAKGDGKLHASEEGFSSQTENDVKVNNTIFRAKDASDQHLTTDVLSTEGLGIRPGIAANMKFGGCGSYPNLPWVSTAGPGPIGKTISGVTYRFSTNQIKIVCACHSTHMTPEEFIQHATEENSSPDGGSELPSFPSNNPPATSAQT